MAKKRARKEEEPAYESLLSIAIEGIRSVFSVIQTKVATEVRETLRRAERDLAHLAVFVFVLALGVVYVTIGLVFFIEAYTELNRMGSYMLLGLALILAAALLRRSAQ